MAITEFAKLKRTRTRLDRQLKTANQVIAAMRDRGLALHASFERPRPRWWLDSGELVEAEAARIVIQHINIIPCGDGLFGLVTSQTYKFNK
jgi:hypothetical protein